MNLFLIFSIIFSIITPIIGIISVFKGEYKPQRITRFVILVVSILFVATLYAQGDRVGLYLALVQLISSSIFFILSIKFGVGGKSKEDIIVLFFAMITLFIWKLTDNALLGLILSLLSDFLGIFPTIKKSYFDPYTEDWKFYGSDTIASFINILAVKSLVSSEVIFPLYIFLINLFIAGIILVRRKYISK